MVNPSEEIPGNFAARDAFNRMCIAPDSSAKPPSPPLTLRFLLGTPRTHLGTFPLTRTTRNTNHKSEAIQHDGNGETAKQLE